MLYGGYGGHGAYFSDAYILDSSKRHMPQNLPKFNVGAAPSWMKLKIDGEAGRKRAGMSPTRTCLKRFL